MAMQSPTTPQKIGRYEILGELGKGAMGVVYKAQDPNIGRLVALKTMRLDVHGMEAEEMLLRFKNEARAAGVLNHSNIVTIYDAGEHDGMFYIAMEFIQGVTLQKVMNDQGILPVEQVLDLSRQICAGLDYAHSHKIVHRDVKPANIMIEPDGRIKIMDFGIAKAEGAQLTTAGQVVGTPNYMSPEQVKGRPLDGRSDLWSFGVILYEMVTGEKPFTGQNVTTIIYKIVNENPIPPKDLDASVHPGLSAVIQRALSKSPEQRYQHGADLVNHLVNHRSIGTETASLLADAGSAHVTKAAATAAPAAAAPTAARTAPSPPKPAAATLATTVRTAAPAAQKPAMTPKPAPARRPAPHDASATLIAGSHESSKAQAMLATAKQAVSRLSPNHWLMIAAGALVLALVGIGFGVYRSSKQLPASALPQSTQAEAPPVNETPAATPRAEPPGSAQSEPQATAAAEPGKPKPRPKTLAKSAAPAVPMPGASIKPPEGAPINGTLRLISNPAGAKVEIDGWSQPDWITPFSSPNLSVGKHKVVMGKPGFVPDTRMVDVTAGQQAVVAVSLKAAVLPARIEVQSDPPGANIFIDNKDTGKQTPATIEVTKGEHSVELRKLGYISTSIAARVGEGDTAHLSQPLRKGTAGGIGKLFGGGTPEGMGNLQVKTKPKGASVTVNGQEAPKTTPFKLPLDPGSYKIVISMEGFQPERQTITVEKGKTVNVEVELKK